MSITSQQIYTLMLIYCFLMWLCSGRVYPVNPVEDFVMEVNTRLVTLSCNSNVGLSNLCLTCLVSSGQFYWYCDNHHQGSTNEANLANVDNLSRDFRVGCPGSCSLQTISWSLLLLLKNVLSVSRHGRRDWNPRVFMLTWLTQSSWLLGSGWISCSIPASSHVLCAVRE